MAKNLGNKKKFAQIGQDIHKISQKPLSGHPGGFRGPEKGQGVSEKKEHPNSDSAQKNEWV